MKSVLVIGRDQFSTLTSFCSEVYIILIYGRIKYVWSWRKTVI